MAYQSNLLGDFWRGYRQRRIGTGMPLSQNEIGGLLGPILANDAQKAERQGLLDERRRQFDRSFSLQEKAQRSQELAGMVGGVGQLAMLPLAYKSASNLFRTPAAAAATTAQGAVAPATAANLTAQGSAAYTGATGTAAYGAAEGSGAAGVLGAESGGLLGGLAPYAGPAGAGLLGASLLTNPLDKILPGGGKTGKVVAGAAGGALAGAAAGAAIGSVGGPVGAVIGGIIGGISSLF